MSCHLGASNGDSRAAPLEEGDHLGVPHLRVVVVLEADRGEDLGLAQQISSSVS